MLTALRTTGVTGFIRAAWNESSQIQRALDLGCSGILVPVINTAEDARRVCSTRAFRRWASAAAAACARTSLSRPTR